MTTIVLASPARNPESQTWSVFGAYEGSQGRDAEGHLRYEAFVFSVRHFSDRAEAERFARLMMERHQADHFERC